MDTAEQERLRAKYTRSAWALPPGFLTARVGVWLVCLVVLLAQLFSLRVGLQRSDDIYKVIGAQSIVQGRGYRDISRPDAPLLTKYPPLPSLTLAPFVRHVGYSLRPLRLLSLGCFWLSLPLLYRLFVPRAGHRATLWLLLLTGLNPTVFRVLNFEGNAGLMILLCVGLVTTLERVPPSPARHAIAVGALLALYFYAHRMAIVLTAGAIAYLWHWQKRRQTALLALALVALCAAPWLWRSYHYTGHWISPEYEREIAGRALGPTSAVGQTLQHIAENIASIPRELGYGLFPWSRASGGAPWPWLQRTDLGWLAPLSEWLLSGLVALGWWRSVRRDAGFVERYFLLHTLMLLVFFVGFQYYVWLLPWLLLWLLRGAQALRLPRHALFAGASLLLLIALGKDARAFWLFPYSPDDRDPRWAWVQRVVPVGEAVAYLGLENYPFGPLRYFDTSRPAIGLTDPELAALLREPRPRYRFLCLHRDSPWARQLPQHGWRLRATERQQAPTVATGDLLAAQRAYLALREPPQALWVWTAGAVY